MTPYERAPGSVEPPVLWTRGRGCAELAGLLSSGEPVRVVGDLAEQCIRHRAELLVTRRLPGHFDLVSVAMPVDLDLDEVGAVVAAVAGGPHSPLAGRVARRLGERLSVEAFMVYAYRQDLELEEARPVIEGLADDVPGLETRLVRVDDVPGLVARLPERTLLVMGAPGGMWLQRAFFGRGARLVQEAPGGAVVVRQAPTRVFQVMTDPVFVGPFRQAVDVLRMHQEPVLAVVDRATLIGMVRRRALQDADPASPVRELMEEPVSVALDAAVEEALEKAGELGGVPLPVVDEERRLVGAFVLPG